MSLAQIAALYAMSISPSVSVIMGFLEPSQIDDVKDLHHYFLDKYCLIGDDEAIEKSIKLVDMRTLQTTDSAMNLPNVLLDSPDPAPEAIQAAR
jgi:hypothetical protein